MLNIERRIRDLELAVAAEPQKADLAVELVEHLDRYQPAEHDTGSYGRCQQGLFDQFKTEDWIEGVSSHAAVAENYKKWLGSIPEAISAVNFSMQQLFSGKLGSIKDSFLDCQNYMKLFDEEGIVPKICFDCYKVQILTADLPTLMQVHFMFRSISFPRDNHRKCMLELRDDVPYPYKGYVYCESEDEAREIRDSLINEFEAYSITGAVFNISHGCSEYGLKYPEFKFAEDGRHRSFQRPEDWAQGEAWFFAKNKPPPGRVERGNPVNLTLKDVLTMRVWVDYAELIRDETAKLFRDAPRLSKPEPFATIVHMQSAKRRAELLELRGRILARA